MLLACCNCLDAVDTDKEPRYKQHQIYDIFLCDDCYKKLKRRFPDVKKFHQYLITL